MSAKHTRFDSEGDVDDGELPPTPPRARTPALLASDEMKGNEVDYGEFVVDRTESIEQERDMDLDISLNITEQSSSSSKWADSILSNILTPNSDENGNKDTKKKEKYKPTCWNCDGEHNLSNCPEKRNFKKINAAKKLHMDKRASQSSIRYHEPNEDGAKFAPGRLSDALREALGLGRHDLPDYIYRMRKMGFTNGYPPGYLKRAIVKDTSGELLRFHSDDATIHDADSERSETPPPTVDASRVIYYHGFNNYYRHIVDREPHFRVPPFDEYVKMLQKDQIKKHSSSRKRRSGTDDGCSTAKRRKLEVISLDDSDSEIQILPPPPPPCLDDIVVIDKGATEELAANESILMEDNVAIVVETPKTPKTPKGLSLSSSAGTPVLTRKRASDGAPVVASKPDLAKFSEGIVPFTAEEETTRRTGFMKNLMKTLKKKILK